MSDSRPTGCKEGLCVYIKEKGIPMVKKKVRRILAGTLLGIGCTFLILKIWRDSAEKHVYEEPDYYKEDLTEILAEPSLSDEDYYFLFMQTGLSKDVLKMLLAEGKEEKIHEIQDRFFKSPAFSCERNSIISWEEWITEEDDKIVFAGLEDGDILITPCSHTMGWRNGHAAIVTDAKKGETLESVVLGEESSIQSLEKWEEYPCVMVFRLKGVSAKIRESIAGMAVKRLLGIPYGITQGVFTSKYGEDNVVRIHCSHLVWEAYRYYGYDLDGDGGVIVTPKDIAESPLLEPVQIVGVKPTKYGR